MSQDWSTNVVDWSGVTAQTTMNNIELMLATLRSNFSGSSVPANLVAGNLFCNTDTGHEGLRVRNAANDAWLAVLLGDASQKVWLYRNDSCEGWDIDAAVTDCVLALKGGTNAYNANGGTSAGTWTQPNHTHTTPDHTHTATCEVSSIDFYYGDSSPYSAHATSPVVVNQDSAGLTGSIEPSGDDDWHAEELSATVDSDGAATTGNGATAATWRPAAAIGTLQYPDLS